MRYVVFAAVLLMACESPQREAPAAMMLARLDDATIQERVIEVRTRLSPDPAGQRILGAMAAHGGLARWYSNGPLGVGFFYEEANRRVPIFTEMMIDTWRARSIHQFPISGDSIRGFFGWTGEEAWQFPPGIQTPVNVRYWSLTPYYFLAFPFIMGDPGVVLELEEDAELDGRLCNVVRMTFEPGTGASPDDYYVVYIDKETRRIAGIRFIVSYPGFFPNGGFFPEKMATPSGYKEVDGVLMPDSILFHPWELDNSRGTQAAVGRVTYATFEPETMLELFDPPEEAEILPDF